MLLFRSVSASRIKAHHSQILSKHLLSGVAVQAGAVCCPETFVVVEVRGFTGLRATER